jgi:hypothetical protein
VRQSAQPGWELGRDDQRRLPQHQSQGSRQGRRRALAAIGPSVEAWAAGPSGAGPGAGNRHIDLFCHLIPRQALVTQLAHLLCRRGVSRRAAATHGDAGTAKLPTHCGRRDAQLGTDLAQGPTLGVQVGRTLNVHRATVTSLTENQSLSDFAKASCSL